MSRDFLALHAGSNRGAPVTDENPVPVKLVAGEGPEGLATQEGQDEIVAAINGIEIPAPVGGALETTQEDVKTAVEAIQAAAEDPGPALVLVQSSEYETVAASQTDQPLGATGAVGDVLEALLVTPTATTVGAISIEDGSTNTEVYAGGTVGADLKPFVIPLFGIASVNGGWGVTTGAGARVIAFGRFT